jgi:hypothetical protein
MMDQNMTAMYKDHEKGNEWRELVFALETGGLHLTLEFSPDPDPDPALAIPILSKWEFQDPI